MSRSVARMLAGAALVAAVPFAAQAQTCTLSPTSATCEVTMTVSANIPELLFLEVGSQTLDFFGTFDWDAFLADPTNAGPGWVALTETGLTIRTNSTYTVALQTSTGWSGTWANSDVRYGTINTGTCTVGDAAGTFTGDDDLTGLTGTATNGYTPVLCLGLAMPTSLADPKLAPGSYTLGLQLAVTAP